MEMLLEKAKANISHIPVGLVSCGPRYGMLKFLPLASGNFLTSFQTIISTALPVIAAQFNASESGYSWIASSYLLANAACIPLWGKLSDIWGRKNIILLANVAFLVGSLICALAKNMAMIVAGRAVQGVGGGGIIILANISVTDMFSVRYANPAIHILNITNLNTEIDLCTTVCLVRLGLLQVHWDQ
jgi:MFS family permease